MVHFRKLKVAITEMSDQIYLLLSVSCPVDLWVSCTDSPIRARFTNVDQISVQLNQVQC